MKITQFDAHNKKSITIETADNSQSTITGHGWYIIAQPNSKFVSFSKGRRDICFGDVAVEIIPEYTNKQYADEYGDRLTGSGASVRDLVHNICFMKMKHFDAHNKVSITIETEGDQARTIISDGYYIIVNQDSDFVSFSKERRGVCFGDVTREAIAGYTSRQYLAEYGDRLTGRGSTVREMVERICGIVA